jgi:hypothetical protein
LIPLIALSAIGGERLLDKLMLPIVIVLAPWDLGPILENWGRIVADGREIEHVNMAHSDMRLGVETFRQQHEYLKTLWDGLRRLRLEGAALEDVKRSYTIERDFPYFKDRLLAVRDINIHENNIEAIWARIGGK